jgi:hypothetical protein
MNKSLSVSLVVILLFLPQFASPFSVVVVSRPRGRDDSGIARHSRSIQRASTMMNAAAPSSSSTTEIYGIPGSGWQSPTWNWGYAQGTGHDCAAICRRRYATKTARQELVDSLLLLDDDRAVSIREPANFEEVKLILALAWQNGRWDGSDGGRGGYGSVLVAMAEAKRYETTEASDDDDDDECARRFIRDVADPKRFQRLPHASDSAQQQMTQMSQAATSGTTADYDLDRRRCSGFVLLAMGFVERGL